MTDNVQQVDGQQAETLILGKFKNTEDLAKSYQELERKLGSRPAEKQAPQTNELAIDTSTPDADKALSDAFAKRQAGSLTDADYTSLQKSGVSRQMADQFFEGRDAVFQTQRSGLLAIAGSAENFKAMTEWAKVNLSPGEVAAYNEAVNSGNPAKMSQAVLALKARHGAGNGNERSTLDGGRPSQFSGVKPYANRQEWLNDTGSPKYRTDETFRNEVTKRMTASVAAKTI